MTTTAALVLASGICFRPGVSEIVVAPGACEVVQVAAEEARDFLSQSLGAEIPVVTARTPGRTALVLGANAWADAAGVTTNGLVRDAFRIRTVGADSVYVVGVDDPNGRARMRTKRGMRGNFYERATSFGVYEFLERYAGIRFYFPGELGTIVPRRAYIDVPETDMTVAPYATERCYSLYDGGLWYRGDDPAAKLHPDRMVNWWRLRMETCGKPCCHGMNFFGYMGRFAESHPEYFVLLPDGRRHNSPRITSPGHPGQLCHTSAVWEEIYQDVRSYLKGEDASVRGIPGGWGRNCVGRRYVDIMPQDGMVKCACPKCQDYYRTQSSICWASALIWSNTVTVANRLKAEGIPGTVTQMAYARARAVPDIDIPDNVDVMVAEKGPFAVGDARELKREYDEVKAWYEKLGRRKVWMWTYVHKYRKLYEPGIVLMTPRAVGRYFKELAPYISGGYMETETDRSFGNLINWYVFSKVMWNPAVDVEALLDEYHRLMFGPASAEMAMLYREIEDIWINRIVGKTVDTPVGPQSEAPTRDEMYSKVYSPEVIRRWEGYFASANAKVLPDSLEARRLALVKRETLDGLKKAIADHIAKRDGFKDFKASAGEGRDRRIPVDAVVDKNRRRTKAPVQTWVNVWKTATHLHVSFDCEESEMAETLAERRAFGDLLATTDNMVGVVICPKGRRADVCQVYLTSAGSVSGVYWVREDGKHKPLEGWAPTIDASAIRTSFGWQGRLAIPLEALPALPDEVPMNFVRTRALKRGTTQMLWGDYPNHFLDCHRFGLVRFADDTTKNRKD